MDSFEIQTMRISWDETKVDRLEWLDMASGP